VKTYKSKFDHEPEREPESLLRFIAQTVICMAVGLLLLALFSPCL